MNGIENDTGVDDLVTLHRFLHLVEENGEFNSFDLDGHECRYLGCVYGDRVRVKLENAYGHRFEVAPARLRGHCFNTWLL